MIIDINDAARRIGIPADLWPGRCYEIACAIVEAGVVEGEAVYGHFLGDVAPGTLFADRPIVQHGWVVMPDGGIVDPTRFVFEGVAPYIYTARRVTPEYDRGGNRLREAWMLPAPEYVGKESVDVKFTPDVADFVFLSLLHTESDSGQFRGSAPPQRVLDWPQLFWLANLPLSSLGQYAKPIYEAIEAAGEGAILPIDNERAVLGRR